LRGRHRGVVGCDDNFDLAPYQLGGLLEEPFASCMHPSPVSGNVLPLHVAELTQSVAEGIFCPAEWIRLEHPNPRNLRLCLGGEWRGEDCGDHAKEGSSLHHWAHLVAESSKGTIGAQSGKSEP
jgi:hypothetical protein